MKNQNGFIQTPLLVAIIAGVLILGGAGYFGAKQYQKYYNEANTQQKALEQAHVEIEKLKEKTAPIFSQEENPILKIERCKIEAKQYAEPLANQAQKETYDNLVINLKYPNASKYNLQPYSNPQTIGEAKNNLENLKTLMDNYNQEVDAYSQGLRLAITVSKKDHDDTYAVYYNKYYSSCLQ